MVLPEASVTVYVIVVTPELKEYVPTLLIPVAGEEEVVAPVINQVSEFTAQLSPIVGFCVITDALHPIASCEILAGQIIVGGWISLIVTIKLHVDALPEASFTVYSMVVIPVLNINFPTLFTPIAGEAAVVAPVISQVNVVTEQLSVVIGFGVFTKALHTPKSEFCEMPTGQVMTGFEIS